VARPKRFELLTPRFVVWCSIQLSYGRLASRQNRPPKGRPAARAIAIGCGVSWQGERIGAAAVCGLAVRPGAAVRRKLDGAVRDGKPQRGADRALDKADVAAMGAHELGGDGKA
jgi:hypothetical protein